jgi:phage gp16-like protein
MNHIAAIHTLKTKIKMAESDYRFLLSQLTGKDSCKAMSSIELAKVRAHFDNLAVRMGVPITTPMRKKLSASSRLIYSLWQQCVDNGNIKNRSFAAMQAFVKNQTGVDHVEFLTEPQVTSIKLALKAIKDRGGV